MFTKILLCAILVFTAAACVGVTPDHLKTYEVACALPPAPATRVAWRSDISTSSLPLLVPFATADAHGHSRGQAIEAFDVRGRKLGADLVLMTAGKESADGSVNVNQGALGVGFATYARDYSGVFYRLAPASLGIHVDASGMITAVEGNARAAGVLEGDRLVSVNGAEVAIGEDALQSPHLPKLLELRPGDDASLVFIRPGVGKKDARVRCTENASNLAALPDAVALYIAERDEKRRLSRLED